MENLGFKKLIVWQKSIKFVKEIYILTSKFPKEELFSLTSQMRRAAISIPSNIAEGTSRKTQNDYKHFMTIARGSAMELETQIEIAYQLNYFEESEYNILISNICELERILTKMSL